MKVVFSKRVREFLQKLAGLGKKAAKVPRSISAAAPGDFVVFEYEDGIPRLVMVTRPILKRPQTGNLLITGFCIDRDFLGPGEFEDFGPQEVFDLYTKKGIPENSFRTYIMSKLKGDLLRIRL